MKDFGIAILFFCTCILSSCTTTYNPGKGEVFPQLDNLKYIAITEGELSKDTLLFDCKLHLAETAQGLGLSGFYIYDRSEQEVLIPHSYKGSDGKQESYDTTKIIMKVYAALSSDLGQNNGQYFLVQDVFSERETRVKKTNELATGLAVIGVPLGILYLVLSSKK